MVWIKFLPLGCLKRVPTFPSNMTILYLWSINSLFRMIHNWNMLLHLFMVSFTSLWQYNEVDVYDAFCDLTTSWSRFSSIQSDGFFLSKQQNVKLTDLFEHLSSQSFPYGRVLAVCGLKMGKPIGGGPHLWAHRPEMFMHIISEVPANTFTKHNGE